MKRAVTTPDLRQHLCLLQRRENLPVEEFVPEFAVEAFDVAVLPRTPRLDEQRLDSQPREPLPDGLDVWRAPSAPPVARAAPLACDSLASRQQGRDPTVAIPPVFAGQRNDVGGQSRLVVCHPGRVSLGAFHLSRHTARPTLGNGQHLGTRARPPSVDASGSEVSPGGFLQNRDVQSLVGDQPLQPLVFQIELFQATGFFHAAVR